MSGVSTLRVVKHVLTIAGKKVHTLNGGRQGPPGPKGDAGATGPAASATGANKQLQFNDAGAFGADSGLTYDKTNGVLTVGGKTVTASAPVLQATQTWNNAAVAFTGALVNVTDTASAAGSKLLDLQVGGSSKFGVDKTGAVFAQQLLTAGTLWGIANNGTTSVFSVNIYQTQAFAWSTGDLALYRGGPGILEQRNGANAQTFRVYNSYMDPANYERFTALWSGNQAWLCTEQGGAGLVRHLNVGTTGAGGICYIITANLKRWQFDSSGHLFASADNSYDIGASGATRPRSGYFGTSLNAPRFNATVSLGTVGFFADDGGGAANSYAALYRQSNEWLLVSNKNGAGTLRELHFGVGGSDTVATSSKLAVTSSVISTSVPVRAASYTVSTLPSAATVGDGSRATVTDATQTFTSANLGAAPTGGGANKVPVIAFGGAWVIG